MASLRRFPDPCSPAADREGKALRVHFTQRGHRAGRRAADAVRSLEVAGADKVFYPAAAVI